MLAIPTVILYFSKLGSLAATVALVLAWVIWTVFVAEAVIMLAVVADRWAWIRGHLFGLALVVVTFPLLTGILHGLLAARALSGLQAVRILQVLYLAKALKIVKSVLILRAKGGARIHPAAGTGLLLVVAAALVGIGHRIVTGEKHATPYHSAYDLVDELPDWSLAVAAASALALVALTLAARRAPSRTGR